ncbi:MAG: hypothetical protein C0501_05990 [Isosphaera sp.]|nr:hypothetical protein [Isosphaera sp.]
MTRPLVVRGAAQAEAETVAEQYELRAAGLGTRFTDALRDLLGGVTAHPESYAVLFGDVRCAPVRKFPFVVLYRVTAAEVVVLAVLPAKSDPAGWPDRA